jgi:hypothetical protein
MSTDAQANDLVGRILTLAGPLSATQRALLLDAIADLLESYPVNPPEEPRELGPAGDPPFPPFVGDPLQKELDQERRKYEEAVKEAYKSRDDALRIHKAAEAARAGDIPPPGVPGTDVIRPGSIPSGPPPRPAEAARAEDTPPPGVPGTDVIRPGSIPSGPPPRPGT